MINNPKKVRKYCWSCGNQSKPDTKFCIKCGVKLDSSSQIPRTTIDGGSQVFIPSERSIKHSQISPDLENIQRIPLNPHQKDNLNIKNQTPMKQGDNIELINQTEKHPKMENRMNKMEKLLERLEYKINGLNIENKVADLEEEIKISQKNTAYMLQRIKNQAISKEFMEENMNNFEDRIDNVQKSLILKMEQLDVKSSFSKMADFIGKSMEKMADQIIESISADINEKFTKKIREQDLNNKMMRDELKILKTKVIKNPEFNYDENVTAIPLISSSTRNPFGPFPKPSNPLTREKNSKNTISKESDGSSKDKNEQEIEKKEKRVLLN